jgi:hypothetical protein
MIFFEKFFKIPGPRDLGMSDNNNSMPCSMFRSDSTKKTWEDYYAKVKELYPVRYFFSHAVYSLWLFSSRWKRILITDPIYWLKCHLMTKHRYHLVDLRKADSQYKFGWMDTDHRMVLAMFSLLIDFVEKEMPHGYFVPTEEEAALDTGECNEHMGSRRQRNNYIEYMAIYNYWKVERPKLEAEHDRLLTAWSAARGVNTPESEKLWDELNAQEAAKDKVLEEMLLRLIAVRHYLWT